MSSTDHHATYFEKEAGKDRLAQKFIVRYVQHPDGKTHYEGTISFSPAGHHNQELAARIVSGIVPALPAGEYIYEKTAGIDNYFALNCAKIKV